MNKLLSEISATQTPVTNVIPYVLLLLFLTSCLEGQVTAEEQPLTKQEEAIAYFKDVALGMEFGNVDEVTRKWQKDIFIYVEGEQDSTLMEELDIIIADLNDLIDDGETTLSITHDPDSSNFSIFFGSGQEFESRFSPAIGYTETNYGMFWLSWNPNNEIRQATMYVDIYRPKKVNQRHLLREELTQSLGMAKDSPKYEDSIFNSSYSVSAVTEYSEMDKDVIQLLYHPQMKTGLSVFQVQPVLESIIDDVVQ
ncbi:MAG: DUF2927 domain-containing protein [Balneolaceae bacterium]|nr:DUF2927 domain-containing protein [Balneolaceae bacterium]